MRIRVTEVVVLVLGVTALVQTLVFLIDAPRSGPTMFRRAAVLGSGPAVQPEHMVTSLAYSAACLVIAVVLLAGRRRIACWLWRGPGALSRRVEPDTADMIVLGMSLIPLGLLVGAWFGLADLAGEHILARVDPRPAPSLQAILEPSILTVVGLWLLVRGRAYARWLIKAETPLVPPLGKVRGLPENQAIDP